MLIEILCLIKIFLIRKWKNCGHNLCFCGTVFDLDKLLLRKNSLEALMQSQDFWLNPHHDDIFNEFSRINSRLEAIEAVNSEYEELCILSELLSSSDDSDLLGEFSRRKSEFLLHISSLRIKLFLTGEYDSYPAIVTIHAGSGGIDAQDWAGMLYRMYMRFCDSMNLGVQILDKFTDYEGGLKSVAFIVHSPDVYGLLKSEGGIHRLVRISPFDSAKRRHTSFASVTVIPEVSDRADISISPADIRIDTFRASGAGGQYVNRTDSAVRITHIPTGIVVTCQNERSQHMNKQTAMRVLRSRLYDMAVKEREQELSSVVGEKKESTWGSQIRSYILHPYFLVKDHRTGFSSSDVRSVLDGNLSPFIFSYLSWLSKLSSSF